MLFHWITYNLTSVNASIICDITFHKLQKISAPWWNDHRISYRLTLGGKLPRRWKFPGVRSFTEIRPALQTHTPRTRPSARRRQIPTGTLRSCFVLTGELTATSTATLDVGLFDRNPSRSPYNANWNTRKVTRYNVEGWVDSIKMFACFYRDRAFPSRPNYPRWPRCAPTWRAKARIFFQWVLGDRSTPLLPAPLYDRSFESHLFQWPPRSWKRICRR